MQPIRIMDADFTLLGEIDTYTSLRWVRRWHKPGEFELRINPSLQNADCLQEDKMIFKAHATTEAAIIKHREIGVNEAGIEELIVKGPLLAGLIGSRITYPPLGKEHDYIHANIETIMKHFVRANFIAPSEPSRILSRLINAPDQARGDKVQFQTRYKQLDEELEKLSITSGLGWHVWLDTKRQLFVFEVIRGRDLTAGQNSYPPAIFSTDYDNIESQSYVSSAIGYKNVAIVVGQGDSGTPKLVTVGQQTGLQRQETFVDAKDVGPKEKEAESLTEAEVERMLQTRGRERLAELGRSESFESKLLANSNLVYRVDYDLGDMVTVVNKGWGITLDARITEMVEVFEPGGFRLDATFGNSLPSLIDKIKQTIGR
ncbi:siphovirus ReqiPepy6 Gp37-like family protein [Brevibacillus sp. NRS-1366]|uniref:siphovirus ReqiPepy6 Gp37-like family protein n=1 Tax=Brevibacillus sp. NRS-1366 TaxID=3233899 RepID=UPI003D211DDC